MIKVQANSDLRVAVNGRRWVFNPRCLSLAPGEVPLEETTGKWSVYHTVMLLVVTHTSKVTKTFFLLVVCVCVCVWGGGGGGGWEGVEVLDLFSEFHVDVWIPLKE